MLLGLPRSFTTQSRESPMFIRSKFLVRVLARTILQPAHTRIATPVAAITAGAFLSLILDSSLIHDLFAAVAGSAFSFSCASALYGLFTEAASVNAALASGTRF